VAGGNRWTYRSSFSSSVKLPASSLPPPKGPSVEELNRPRNGSLLFRKGSGPPLVSGRGRDELLSFLLPSLPLRPPLRTFLSADEDSVLLRRRPSSGGMILSSVVLLAELESESLLEVFLRPRLNVSLNPDLLHFRESSNPPVTDISGGEDVRNAVHLDYEWLLKHKIRLTRHVMRYNIV
jgi:hypothetical protein